MCPVSRIITNCSSPWPYASNGSKQPNIPMTLPRCLLITPARNEERYLENTIQAMLAQKVHPIKWVIINDGSTDATPGIIDRYAASYGWIERFDMPSHRDRSFAAKAHCFNAAY